MDPVHLAAAGAVVAAYGAVLADPASPYAECMYRPVSELPCRKEHILESLETLLEVAEGGATDTEVVAPSEDAEASIRTGIEALRTFVDVPPSGIPTDPRGQRGLGRRSRVTGLVDPAPTAH